MQPRRRYGSVSILVAFALAAFSGGATSAPAHQPGYLGIYGDYLRARFAVSQGDLGTAADDFGQALAGDPGNPLLTQQAFLAAALAGRPDAARLAEALPGNQAALLLLADNAARAGQWDAAAARFASLPHDGLSGVVQPLLQAWSQQGDGQTDAALATLRPFETGPHRNIYLLHAALIADLANRSADARRLYHAARAAYPSLNLRLAQVLASWETRDGHAPEAEAILRKLVDRSPELAVALPGLLASDRVRAVGSPTDGLAEAYLALAASLRSQDGNASATLVTTYALDLRPDLTPARLLLADSQDNEGHLRAALATLKPVAASDPLITLVRLRRASLVQRLGDVDAAIRELDQLARDMPTSPIPLMQKGDVLREASRFHEAVSAYDAAIGRLRHPDASDATLFYARAIAEDGAHDWPRAQADLEHALSLSPDQPSILNYLGYSWTEQNHDLPRARQMIEKAAEERPNEGAIIDSLGWVMLKQGQVGDAVDTLERAVELEPEDPSINAHLGDAYQADGRTLDAIYQWQRALTFHPTPEDAAAVQAKLRAAGPAAQHGGQETEAVPHPGGSKPASASGPSSPTR